jgi:tetratricopeptide (TPR) repeat protein
LKRPEDALELLSQFEKLMAEHPEQGARLAQMYSGTVIRVANSHDSLGRPKDAERTYRQALQAFQKVVLRSPDTRYRSELGRMHNWLGLMLERHGRRREAEQAFRQALGIYEQLTKETAVSDSHWHRRELAWTSLNLANCLNSDRRFAEAMDLYSRAATLCDRLAAERPTDGIYPFWGRHGYSNLVILLAADSRPREAEQALRKLLGLRPGNPVAYYHTALLRLHLGDRAGYRELCGEMLKRFKDSSDASAGNWAAWTCALTPDAVDDWQPVVRLVEKVLAADPKNCDKLLTLGAVLYRAGRFHEAEQRLAEAEAAFKKSKKSRMAAAYFHFFRAMALHRLGHQAEAKKWLDAVSAIEQPPGGTATTHPNWNRLALGLFRREAEALLSKKD